MSTPAKLAAFAVVLAAAFGGAWVVGAGIDPLAETPPVSHGQTDHDPATQTSGHENQR